MTYPANDDAEVLEGVIRQMKLEFARDLFRPHNEEHTSRYWHDLNRYNRIQSSSDKPVRDPKPFPPYDPSELSPIWEACLAEASRRVDQVMRETPVDKDPSDFDP